MKKSTEPSVDIFSQIPDQVDKSETYRNDQGETQLVDGTTGSEGGGPQVGYGPKSEILTHSAGPGVSVADHSVASKSDSYQTSTTGERDMKLIPTQVHGLMDYLLGVVLMGAPWIFQFYAGGAESVVPILLGASVIIYSLLTAYEWGVVPRLSMNTHLALDMFGGMLLALSPWLFGFAAAVWIPHVVFGVLETVTALMTKTVPTHIPGQNTTPAV